MRTRNVAISSMALLALVGGLWWLLSVRSAQEVESSNSPAISPLPVDVAIPIPVTTREDPRDVARELAIVSALGEASCAQWLEYRAAGNQQRDEMMDGWMQEALRNYNTSRPDKVTPRNIPDARTIGAYADKYCRANPSLFANSAVARLQGELRFGQYQGLPRTDIHDVYVSDPGRLSLRPARDRIVPVSVSLGASNARVGDSVAVEALQLDIDALLAASTDRSKAGTAGEKYFSLRIEGHEYVLDVVEVAFDPDFRMRHVLAGIVNATAPGAHARFTVDPVSGIIAGTVINGTQRYRMVSGNDPGALLVFRLGSAQTDAGDLITSEKLVKASIAIVERRHAQAERIAEIKPTSFSNARNGYMTSLLGGAIGKVDVERLGESQVIAQLLKELSVFTRATGNEEFEIRSVSRMDDKGRREVQFRQLIDGIPVDIRPSFVTVESDGSVFHLATGVFDPSGLPTDLIGREEALRIATEEFKREVGHLGIRKIVWMSDVGLQYVVKSMSLEEYAIELTPTWRVPAVAYTVNGIGMGEAAAVLINAATGETKFDRGGTLD